MNINQDFADQNKFEIMYSKFIQLSIVLFLISFHPLNPLNPRSYSFVFKRDII